jgi:hypothetical protein
MEDGRNDGPQRSIDIFGKNRTEIWRLRNNCGKAQRPAVRSRKVGAMLGGALRRSDVFQKGKLESCLVGFPHRFDPAPASRWHTVANWSAENVERPSWSITPQMGHYRTDRPAVARLFFAMHFVSLLLPHPIDLSNVGRLINRIERPIRTVDWRMPEPPVKLTNRIIDADDSSVPTKLGNKALRSPVIPLHPAESDYRWFETSLR